jgi:hypothetical protein
MVTNSTVTPSLRRATSSIKAGGHDHSRPTITPTLKGPLDVFAALAAAVAVFFFSADFLVAAVAPDSAPDLAAFLVDFFLAGCSEPFPVVILMLSFVN